MTVIWEFVWNFYLAVWWIDSMLSLHFGHSFSNSLQCFCILSYCQFVDCHLLGLVLPLTGSLNISSKGQLVSGASQAISTIHHQPVLPRHQSTRDAKVILNRAEWGESRVFPSHVVPLIPCFLVVFCLQEAERFRYFILKRLKVTNQELY